jgi:hypothetical protein
MSAISIRPVSDKAAIRDFLEVPFALYRDDPNWVAPLYLERFDHLNTKKNPYFQHADAQLFVAYRDGQARSGRISAQHDRLRLEHHKDNAGQFGFFESENDPAVAHALFGAAEDWLRQRGLGKVQGPFNFSINDELGMLVHGLTTSPT